MNIAQTGHNNCTCTRVEVERTGTTISVLVSDHHHHQQQQQLISERAQLPSESLLRRQQRQNENNNNNPNMNKSKNTSKGNGKNEHKHENENEKEQPVCQLSTTTPLPVSLLENIVTTNLVSPTVSPFPEVLPEDGDDTNIDDNDNDNTDDNNNDDDGPPKVPLPATATATATTATATATRTEDSEQEEEEEELDSGSGSDSYLYLPLARCLEEAAEGNTEATKQLVIRYTNGTGGATRDIVRAFFAMETYLRSGSGDSNSNSNGDNNGNNNNNNNKRNCCVREPDTIRLFLYTSARLLLGSSTNSEFPEEQRRLPPGLRDARRAVRLLEIAARTYHCTASMRLLGTGLYLEGRHPNVPRDLERALHWLARGARCGDGLSAFRLAMAFHAGPITPVHQGLERKWLAISDALGCPLAGQALQVDAVRGRRMGRDEARRRLRHLGKEKNITDYLETDRTRECSNPGCDRVEPESASTSTSASTSELEERFPLCERCKQVKYCSRECQVLHWRMHGGHREKCRELETGKEEMKRCNRNIALPFANICWYCYSYQPEPGAQFLACSSCMVARYCSRECQLLDYRDGHKKDCELVCTYLEEADRLLGELDARTRTTPSGTE